MARIASFEANTERYDQWFVHHDSAYISELTAIRRLLPRSGLGVEIGVGTGRFATTLGVPVGVDPSTSMLKKACGRRLIAASAVAEALPFMDHAFDYCLIVTTICFVDDAEAMMREAARVLKPGGVVVVGFVDRESPLGQHYLAHQSENVFYRDATFFSVSEVEALLNDAGLEDLNWVQTLFDTTSETAVIEEARSGHGDGSFVVVRAARPS